MKGVVGKQAGDGVGGTSKPSSLRQKKRPLKRLQGQQSARPVYIKRQKSHRHRKILPYSEPDALGEGWAPAAPGARSDLPPAEGEDRFLPGSLREMMWRKRVADLSTNERRRYLKSRRKTNPEVGDVTGMRRQPAKASSLRRKRGESQGRFLARVERTAQQTLLAAQYSDRFGGLKNAKNARSTKGSGEHTTQRTPQHHREASATEGGPPAEKHPRRQRRRDASRPARLEPPASEPPKFLARLKYKPHGGSGGGGKASGSGLSSGSWGGVAVCGSGVSTLDRRLLLT